MRTRFLAHGGVGCTDFEIGFSEGISARDLRSREGFLRNLVEAELMDPSALNTAGMPASPQEIEASQTVVVRVVWP